MRSITCSNWSFLFRLHQRFYVHRNSTSDKSHLWHNIKDGPRKNAFKDHLILCTCGPRTLEIFRARQVTICNYCNSLNLCRIGGVINFLCLKWRKNFDRHITRTGGGGDNGNCKNCVPAENLKDLQVNEIIKLIEVSGKRSLIHIKIYDSSCCNLH